MENDNINNEQPLVTTEPQQPIVVPAETQQPLSQPAEQPQLQGQPQAQQVPTAEPTGKISHSAYVGLSMVTAILTITIILIGGYVSFFRGIWSAMVGSDTRSWYNWPLLFVVIPLTLGILAMIKIRHLYKPIPQTVPKSKRIIKTILTIIIIVAFLFFGPFIFWLGLQLLLTHSL